MKLKTICICYTHSLDIRRKIYDYCIIAIRNRKKYTALIKSCQDQMPDYLCRICIQLSEMTIIGRKDPAESQITVRRSLAKRTFRQINGIVQITGKIL